MQNWLLAEGTTENIAAQALEHIHSNEVIIAFSGDASAVKTAVLTAREIGLALICAMGEYPGGPSTPYLN